MGTRADVVAQLSACGIIAVVRLESAAALAELTSTLQANGITAIEFTMTTPGALETLHAMTDQYPDVLFGAGTVLRAADAERAISAGARFVVSPVLKQEVIHVGHDRDVPVIPGAYTPTEMEQASEWGGDLIKLFPASSVGPDYIKAVLAPLPKLKIMPTGGVNAENGLAYLRAGATCLGVGSELANKKAVEEGRFDDIAAYAKRLLALVAEARRA